MDKCERRETCVFEETDEAPRNCAALSLKAMRVTCLPMRPSQRDACYQNLHAFVFAGAPRILGAVALSAVSAPHAKPMPIEAAGVGKRQAFVSSMRNQAKRISGRSMRSIGKTAITGPGPRSLRR